MFGQCRLREAWETCYKKHKDVLISLSVNLEIFLTLNILFNFFKANQMLSRQMNFWQQFPAFAVVVKNLSKKMCDNFFWQHYIFDCSLFRAVVVVVVGAAVVVVAAVVGGVSVFFPSEAKKPCRNRKLDKTEITAEKNFTSVNRERTLLGKCLTNTYSTSW